MKKYLVVYEWVENGKNYVTGQDFNYLEEAYDFIDWIHKNLEETYIKLINVRAAKPIL